VVQYSGAQAPQAGQLHLSGGFASAHLGVCGVLQYHHGETLSVDLWTETTLCLKGALFPQDSTRVWACRAMSQYNLCCVVQCTLMTTDEWTSPSQGPDHTAVRCSAGTPHEVTAEYARSGHVGHHNGHFSTSEVAVVFGPSVC